MEVVRGHARLVGRHRVQVGEERLEAENILVATGSRPAVPPIPGIGAEHVLDSDRVFDLAEVPSSIAIIGGGYIGLELATYFREVGAEVVVFEMLPQIAANCDGDVWCGSSKRSSGRDRLPPLLPGARRRGGSAWLRRWSGTRRHISRSASSTPPAGRRWSRGWAWRRSAWISAPRASGSATRARPACPGCGPAAT